MQLSNCRVGSTPVPGTLTPLVVTQQLPTWREGFYSQVKANCGHSTPPRAVSPGCSFLYLNVTRTTIRFQPPAGTRTSPSPSKSGSLFPGQMPIPAFSVLRMPPCYPFVATIKSCEVLCTCYDTDKP